MGVLGHLIRVPRAAWLYARSDAVTWLEDERLAACRYPRSERELRELAERGVRLVVNLHSRAHAAEQLERLGLVELHLPVADFTPPSAAQLQVGVEAMCEAVDAGERVAVHCGGGLGRTGTLMACYLVRRGASAEEAIAQVRRARPGSIETRAQEAAVHAFALADARS
jgi:atypical dual specificity phosphatase